MANVPSGLKDDIVRHTDKWKYAKALDRTLIPLIESMEAIRPKRATSIDSDAPAVQAGEPGANPRVALYG
jgi:hypothetical protein